MFLSPERNTGNLSFDAILGSILAINGLSICMSAYTSKHTDTPESTRLITDHLERAIGICTEIGSTARLDKYIAEGKQRKLDFVCKWSDVRAGGNRRLDYYLEEVFDIPKEFSKSVTSAEPNDVKMEFEDMNSNIGTLQFKIDYSKYQCDITFDDKKGFREKNLIITQISSDFLLYQRLR